MGAYVAMGLAESLIAPRVRKVKELPASVRAELEADEALEPDDDDVELKEEGDEYI